MTVSSGTRHGWAEANQRDLLIALRRVQMLLEHQPGDPPDGSEPAHAAPLRPADGYALDRLRRSFDLSSFELGVVVLCAGAELDERMASVIAAAQGDAGRRFPTFSLALAVLPDAHWSALAPSSPLRGWRLVHVDGPGLTVAGLRLDERILHFLAGVNQVDEALRGIVRAVPAPESPGDHEAELARTIVEELTAGRSAQVIGARRDSRREAIATIGAVLGAPVLLLSDEDVPDRVDERYELARMCSREWHLGGAITAVDVTTEHSDERVAAFAGDLRAPYVVLSRNPLPGLTDRAAVFEIAPRSASARIAAWQRAIGDRAAGLNGALSRASAAFDLDVGALRSVARAAAASSPDGTVAAEALWDACRLASRPRMEGLATRIDALAGWDVLVLPERQRTVLRTIATHVRHRHRVYEEWGFAARSDRGLGISALFVGESGTGKTMAAEVLARELRLDLYRVDVATVISKYIGETEKNLRQLFDAAEGSGAVLLFDEADALFGKRSEVRDSHDRYANVEVSYLLQRMELFRGLAILTTNMKQALDPAFQRRIRFVVRFPFPDAAMREAIWRGVFPTTTPLGELDFGRLAQLDVAGGQIRSMAMAAAFLAADRGEPVGMPHLAEAARAEYAKAERSVSDAESRGWM